MLIIGLSWLESASVAYDPIGMPRFKIFDNFWFLCFFKDTLMDKAIKSLDSDGSSKRKRK
jgi:hypothetical protein